MANTNSNPNHDMDLIEVIHNTEGDIIDDVHREWLEQQSPEHMERREVMMSDPKGRELWLILEYRKATMTPQEFREWVEPLHDHILETQRKRKSDQQ